MYKMIDPKDTVKYIYSDLLKLRKREDHLAIIADSASDLRLVTLLMSEAGQYDVSVELLYYRDIYSDDLVAIRKLINSVGSKMKISIYDVLVSKEKYRNHIEAFRERKFSVAVNLMGGSYLARTDIAEIAYAEKITIAEIPSFDLESMSSPVFTTDRHEMVKRGDEIIKVLNGIKRMKIRNDKNGTDFTLEVYPQDKWVNEADLDFSLRNDINCPVDNIPTGEVYKNIKLGTANGKLVIYEVDPDVLKWAVRNKGLSSDLASKLIYDPSDPISLTFKNGKLVEIDGILRGAMLKGYLIDQAVEDKDQTAPYKPCEIAIGINTKARLAEEGATSVLETEKAPYWHFAIGNSPVRISIDADISDLNTSDTHLDFVFRGKLDVTAEYLDGSEKILTGKDGLLNQYCLNGTESDL